MQYEIYNINILIYKLFIASVLVATYISNLNLPRTPVYTKILKSIKFVQLRFYSHTETIIGTSATRRTLRHSVHRVLFG